MSNFEIWSLGYKCVTSLTKYYRMYLAAALNAHEIVRADPHIVVLPNVYIS